MRISTRVFNYATYLSKCIAHVWEGMYACFPQKTVLGNRPASCRITVSYQFCNLLQWILTDEEELS